MKTIKELRLLKRISQQKLASDIGVSRSTVAMWESGGSQPDNSSLRMLADYFNTTTDYILGRTEGMDGEKALSHDGKSAEITQELRNLTDRIMALEPTRRKKLVDCLSVLLAQQES